MSISATLIEPLRVQYDQRIDKNEFRLSQYGVWDYFQMETTNPQGIISPDMVAKYGSAWDKRTKIPVLKEGEITVTEGLAPLTVATKENESELITLTPKDLWFGFTMMPAQYEDGRNNISYQTDWRRKFMLGVRGMAEKLNESGRALLEAQKNQKFTDLLNYDATGNVVTAPKDRESEIFADLRVIMESNDYSGPATIIANGGVQSTGRKFGHNFDNNVVSILDQNKFMKDYGIVNDTGIYGTGFYCLDGNVGLLYQVKPENRMKYKTLSGKKWDILSNVPAINADLMEFYYDDAADISAYFTDNIQSMSEAYIYSIRVYFVTAYNSDIANKTNPFIKFDIANS